MKIAFYSTKKYDKESFTRCDTGELLFTFLPTRLTKETVKLAYDHDAVRLFVNDIADQSILEQLYQGGCRMIALRCAGFNNIDLEAADKLGLTVARVPAYSPQAVAEHAVALILSMNRKTHRAFNRVREGNFELDGLLGFDLYQKNVGVIGTGRIGEAFIRIMQGFGCSIFAYDPSPSKNLPSSLYYDLDRVLKESDITSLHCPLNEETHHLLNQQSFDKMKEGAMVINTSRGGLIDTPAAIQSLKKGRIGYLGLDVYEEESALFFDDHSQEIISDDQIIRLMSFPNVLITGQQGFFTQEAFAEIAKVTCENLLAFENQKPIESDRLLLPK